MAIIVDKYELIFSVPNLVRVSEKIYLKVLGEVRTKIGKNLRPLYRHMLQRWASVCNLRLSWGCKKNPELQIQVLDVSGSEVKVRICFPLEGSSYLRYVVLQKVANKYELEGKVRLSPALGMEMNIFLSGEFEPVQVKFPGDFPANGHGQKYFIATSETGKPWDELNIR